MRTDYSVGGDSIVFLSRLNCLRGSWNSGFSLVGYLRAKTWRQNHLYNWWWSRSFHLLKQRYGRGDYPKYWFWRRVYYFYLKLWLLPAQFHSQCRSILYGKECMLGWYSWAKTQLLACWGCNGRLTGITCSQYWNRWTLNSHCVTAFLF